MARAIPSVIVALRQTIDRLQQGADYQWTHQGACNCGHLAQVLTPYSSAEIHRFALQKAGDWAEHAYDFCPQSGLPIDHIIDTIIACGFSAQDIVELERLSNASVLRAIPVERRPLRRNHREDLLLYLRTWMQQLEADWAAEANWTKNLLAQAETVLAAH
jgi:hypothetical protein